MALYGAAEPATPCWAWPYCRKPRGAGLGATLSFYARIEGGRWPLHPDQFAIAVSISQAESFVVTKAGEAAPLQPTIRDVRPERA